MHSILSDIDVLSHGVCIFDFYLFPLYNNVFDAFFPLGVSIFRTDKVRCPVSHLTLYALSLSAPYFDIHSVHFWSLIMLILKVFFTDFHSTL